MTVRQQTDATKLVFDNPATGQELFTVNATGPVRYGVPQAAAIGNPSGGSVVDVECRAQLVLLLNLARTKGEIPAS